MMSLFFFFSFVEVGVFPQNEPPFVATPTPVSFLRFFFSSFSVGYCP